MTEQLSVHNFCRDSKVVYVIFFKKDGSRQTVSCDNLGEGCDENAIVFGDVVLVARLMLGGAVDYPYVSSDVASRRSTISLEVTTDNGEVQKATFKSIIEVVEVSKKTGGYEAAIEKVGQARQGKPGEQEVTSSRLVEGLVEEIPLVQCDDMAVGGEIWDSFPGVSCRRCRKFREGGSEVCERDCWLV